MKRHLKSSAIALSVLGLGALSAHAANITFSIVANSTTDTWAAYGLVDNTSGTTATGLAGFSITVAGSNGLLVTSSIEAASGSYVSGTGKIGTTGFSDVSDGSAGTGGNTAGANIQGAQAFGTNKNQVKSSMHNIYFGYALTTGTADDGSGNTWGSGNPAGIPANAALLATGTFSGTGGTLTVSGVKTGITMLPASVTAANATSSGASFTTFSPSNSTAGTWTLNSGPVQTNVSKLALATTLAALNDGSDQDNYAATGGTNAVLDTVTAFGPKVTNLHTVSNGSDQVDLVDVQFGNPQAGAPTVVLLWLTGSTALSQGLMPSGTLYTPGAAATAAGFETPQLDGYYPGWTDMLVFANAQAAHAYLGLNIPAGDTLTGIAVVPEPASLGLLALGAMGLLGRKRK